MMHAVINHLWQSTVFAILVGLLTLAFRKNRAQVRYWLWFSASVKFLVPFALLLSLGGYLGRSPVAKSLPVPAIPSAVLQVAEPFPVDFPAPPPSQTHVDWVPIILVSLWMCGFLSVTLNRFRAWLRIRAALRSSTPLEISFPVPVRSTTHPLEPGVVGFIRSRLLLAEGIKERLTPEQLQVLLTHELCHVRRRDNLTATIHMVVEALFWFHPLVWWISAHLMEERERACDEAVLELGGEPQVYAESILKICQWCVESPLACAPGIAGADLRRRLTRILTQRPQNKLGSYRKMLLALVSAAAIVGPVLCGFVNFPHNRAPSVQNGHRALASFEVASMRPRRPSASSSAKGTSGKFTRTKLAVPADPKMSRSTLAAASEVPLLTRTPPIEGTLLPDEKTSRHQARPQVAITGDSTGVYASWIKGPVAYIATKEERLAFRRLTTDMARVLFIWQFWEERNPQPGSSENEYRQEFYRRVAYANEHFGLGVPGWRTDRGRIYIMWGSPNEEQERDSKHPSEGWYYNYIPGIGENVKLTFVDPTNSGDYHLSLLEKKNLFEGSPAPRGLK
jgi:GWxTD domain-containing protein